MKAALKFATRRNFVPGYAAPLPFSSPPPPHSPLRSAFCSSCTTSFDLAEAGNSCDHLSLDDMKSRGAAHMRAGKRPVSESSRISLVERLEQFRASSDQKTAFEPGLSNNERAVIHEMCKKMGLKSKSFGNGNARRLTVFKHRLESSKDQSILDTLVFSADSRAAIQQLFYSYPPTENEASWKFDNIPALEGRSNRFLKAKQQAMRAAKSVMNETDIKKQVEMLGARLRTMPALQQISQERERLPIAKYKDEITSTIEKNQVVLIVGETGCGKTTQVPQFILDHMWSAGRPCRIFCTQPRRISASSVAERIAMERGESVGETVGYQIKLESKGGMHSSLMFCTTGVLLRKIVNADGDVGDVISSLYATHIIVDEIHERDRDADFMLIALRDLLSKKPDLRLVLMSATLDADLFSSYFSNCPVIKVPGFTYPVQTFYLEDVIVATEVGENSLLSPISTDIECGTTLIEEDAAAMDEAIGLAWLEDDFELFTEMLSRITTSGICNYQQSTSGMTALMVAAGKGMVDEVLVLLSRGADVDLTSYDGKNVFDYAEEYGQPKVKEMLLKHKDKENDPNFTVNKAELLEKYLSNIDQDEIDTSLIERLLLRICTSTIAGVSPDQHGSVLIFLPGWEEITRTRECLEASSFFGDSTKFLLLPLHSMIPSIEQRKVFQSPKPGVRKIILATNIAETAITINDVVFVIDSGRVKEKSYDPYNNVSTLQTAWISKASARQREGRAGRCQPGVCYHLYSKVRANALPDFQLPEIKRTSLEELCLQVKLLDPNHSISNFLSKAIDPPNELAVTNAVRLLQDIGALTSDEKLTELGKQLGALPVHPSTSKMLLLGILLNCLDPALTIACAAGFRDPFILPTTADQRKRALAAKRDLALTYGGYSDQLAIVAAFDKWEKAQARGFERRFCELNFLSMGTMSMLAAMRDQLRRELADRGFISRVPHPCSLNASDPGILRALLVAGSYPMYGMLLPALPNGKKAVVQTAQGMKVRIHPHSLNFSLVRANNMKQEPSNKALLVYDEVIRGEAWMYMRNCTVIKPHPLVLLATEMVVAPCHTEEGESDDDELSSEGSDNECPTNEVKEEQIMSKPDKPVLVVIDRWLKFQTTAVEAAQIYCLRERLSAAIALKLKSPREMLTPVLGNSVFVVACLLSYDGKIDMQQASTFQRSNVQMANDQSGDMVSKVQKSRIEKSNEYKGGSSGTNISSVGFKQHSGPQKSNIASSHFMKRQRGNNLG